MLRSLARTRRTYANNINLRPSATSPSQVLHVITTSSNHFPLFFSTNKQINNSQKDQIFDEKDHIFDDLGQNPELISSELNENNAIEVEKEENEVGLGQNPGFISSEIDESNTILVEKEENPELISSEFDENNSIEEEKEVKEVDLNQLENVLSLLQSSTKKDDSKSLGLALDEMSLVNVDEEFVVRVLETPLVPGENLIGFLKWVMKKVESFLLTSKCLEALVKAVSGQRNAYDVWDLVKEVGEVKEGENRVLTTEILNGLISELSRLGKAKAVKEVFDKFGDFECVPDSDTYYITIDALCRRSFYNWACLVVEKMVGSGSLPEGEKVGKIISYLCKGEKAKEAHSVYLLAKEKNKCPPRSKLNYLVFSLSQGDKESVRLGIELLNDFSGEERKFAIKPFSSVVRGLCKVKEVGLAKSLLLKMIEEGPPPGNAVFNSIIAAFSKSGEMGEAKNMVKMMENRGLKPDVFTYTVIISGYTKGGEMEEACKVLDEAKEKHSKLSQVTYHSLIRGYCKLGEFGKAVKLLDEMREAGVEPNMDEYNKLIQTLCLKALDFETAEKLAEEMSEKGLHLNGITKALLKAGKEVAEEEGTSVSGDGEAAVAV